MPKSYASFFVCMMMSFLAFTFLTPAPVSAQPHYQNNASESMQTMRIMIAKLRKLVFNLRDIGELEKIGLPRSDADLMRLALQAKINQTQKATLGLIRRL